jgi:hypothetical protein
MGLQKAPTNRIHEPVAASLDRPIVLGTWRGNAPAPQHGTDIYQPLFHVLDQGRVGVGLGQVFVLTDGEISDTDRVIQLALSNRWNSRIFTVGIGDGADAGLMEGLANVTGGRSDFVVSGEDVSSKVIPQHQTSLSGLLTEVSVHVAEDSSINIAPFPILPISQCVSSTVFVKLSEPIESRTGVLVSGDYCCDRQDFVIESHPARIDTTLLYSLYAYEALWCLERDVSHPDVFAKCVNLSVSSGVLCKESAFVGVSQQPVHRRISRSDLRLLGLISHDSFPDDLICSAWCGARAQSSADNRAAAGVFGSDEAVGPQPIVTNGHSGGEADRDIRRIETLDVGLRERGFATMIAMTVSDDEPSERRVSIALFLIKLLFFVVARLFLLLREEFVVVQISRDVRRRRVESRLIDAQDGREAPVEAPLVDSGEHQRGDPEFLGHELAEDLRYEKPPEVCRCHLVAASDAVREKAADIGRQRIWGEKGSKHLCSIWWMTRAPSSGEAKSKCAARLSEAITSSSGTSTSE